MRAKAEKGLRICSDCARKYYGRGQSTVCTPCINTKRRATAERNKHNINQQRDEPVPPSPYDRALEIITSKHGPALAEEANRISWRPGNAYSEAMPVAIELYQLMAGFAHLDTVELSGLVPKLQHFNQLEAARVSA